MDVALSRSITSTATQMASHKQADAVNVRMLDKALDMQALAAADMIQAMYQSMPQPQLATSGSLGTRLNTFA